MTQKLAIKLFDEKQVRIVWDEQEQKYYFSIVDVVQVLTEQPTPRGASTYWAVLKKRLKQEGADELLTNCKQLKLQAADGKMRMTDVADTEQLLRIIQSIPSKKAEPLKQWLADEGGQVAHVARQQLEHSLGRSVVTSQKAADYIKPIEQAQATELLPGDDE
ncbi:MAG: hypothetical protein IJV34_08470 [Prevotella sp.]|nr:hypothetical protein [Prevotella sp.]